MYPELQKMLYRVEASVRVAEADHADAIPMRTTRQLLIKLDLSIKGGGYLQSVYATTRRKLKLIEEGRL